MSLHRFFFRSQHNTILCLGIELDRSQARVAAIDREANIKQETIVRLGKEASASEARVAELEAAAVECVEVSESVCGHNRTPLRCWECQSSRARAAERREARAQISNADLKARVAELEAKHAKRRGIVRRLETSQRKINEAASRLGYDPEKTDDRPGDWLAARVAALESELVADRVLHGAGKCTCHREGTCTWCRWVAAQERVEELEEPQVGWTECPHCGMEHDVQLSRGRTNDPNRPDPRGDKVRLTVGTDAHTGERTFTRQRGEGESGGS